MFDENKALSDIAIKLGKKRPVVGRKTSTYPMMPTPPWAVKEPLGKLFESQSRIVRHGTVGWGGVIQANKVLFEVGPQDAPLQVIYAQKSDASLRDTCEAAGRAGGLKGTQPMHGEEARLARVLTNEHARVFGMSVPESVSGPVEMRTSAMYLCRKHVPGEFLVQGWFPILYEEKTGMALIVPQSYWPDELTSVWTEPITTEREHQRRLLAEACAKNEGRVREFIHFLEASHREGTRKEISEITLPVSLTRAAGDYLGPLSEQSQTNGRVPIRVQANPSASGGIDTVISFEEEPINKASDISYKHRGVRLVVSRKMLPALMGTSIDYCDASTPGRPHGLQIKNPNFS